MRKILYLLPFVLFSIISCSSDSDPYIGKWIDKERELDLINIEKNNNNFLVTINEQKYPAKLADGLMEISAGFEIKAIIDKNNTLIISGEEYIRYDEAIRPKYLGKWNKDGFVIEISNWDTNYMKVKAIKGSWAREYKTASYKFKDGKIEFKDYAWDGRINYFIIEEDGRLKQTVNGTDFNYYEKID